MSMTPAHDDLRARLLATADAQRIGYRDADLLREAAAALSALPEAGEADDWRERERLSLLSLRNALEGFEVSIEAAPLQPPMTYLDRVTLTCEFQPGAGGEVIAKRIAKILAAPARTATPPAAVSQPAAMVEGLRELVAKWRADRSDCCDEFHCGRDQCADELAALLSAGAVQGGAK